MEILPKDIREKIGKELSIRDFLSYCASNKNMCLDDNIWRRRGNEDYGILMEFIVLPKYKERYLLLSKEIFGTVDKVWQLMYNVLQEVFGDSLFQLIREKLEQECKPSILNYVIDILQKDYGNNFFYGKVSQDLREFKGKHLILFEKLDFSNVFFQWRNIYNPIVKLKSEFFTKGDTTPPLNRKEYKLPRYGESDYQYFLSRLDYDSPPRSPQFERNL